MNNTTTNNTVATNDSINNIQGDNMDNGVMITYHEGGVTIEAVNNVPVVEGDCMRKHSTWNRYDSCEPTSLMQHGHDVSVNGCNNPSCISNIIKGNIWYKFNKVGLVGYYNPNNEDKVERKDNILIPEVSRAYDEKNNKYLNDHVYTSRHRYVGEYIINVNKHTKFSDINGKWHSVQGVLKMLAINILKNKTGRRGGFSVKEITTMIVRLKDTYSVLYNKFNHKYTFNADKTVDGLSCTYCNTEDLNYNRSNDTMEHEAIFEGDTLDGATNKIYKIHKYINGRWYSTYERNNMRNKVIKNTFEGTCNERLSEFDACWSETKDYIMPSDDYDCTDKSKYEYSLDKAIFTNENGDKVTFGDATSDDKVMLLNNLTDSLEAEFAARQAKAKEDRTALIRIANAIKLNSRIEIYEARLQMID